MKNHDHHYHKNIIIMLYHSHHVIKTTKRPHHSQVWMNRWPDDEYQRFGKWICYCQRQWFIGPISGIHWAWSLQSLQAELIQSRASNTTTSVLVVCFTSFSRSWQRDTTSEDSILPTAWTRGVLLSCWEQPLLGFFHRIRRRNYSFNDCKLQLVSERQSSGLCRRYHREPPPSFYSY